MAETTGTGTEQGHAGKGKSLSPIASGVVLHGFALKVRNDPDVFGEMTPAWQALVDKLIVDTRPELPILPGHERNIAETYMRANNIQPLD